MYRHYIRSGVCYDYSSIWLIFGLLFGWALYSFAEDMRPLSLVDVTQSVVRQHPKLMEAQQSIEAAGGDVLGAHGFLDPTLGANLSLTPRGDYPNQQGGISLVQRTTAWGSRVFADWKIGRGDFADYDKGQLTADRGKARIGVGVPLLKGGRIDEDRATLAKSRQALAATRQDAVLLQLELIRLASRTYWDWVAAGKQLAVARRLAEISTDRMAQVTSRVKRGDLPGIDIVDNKRALLKRQGGVIKAQRKLEKAALKLSLYVRGPSGDPLVVDPSRLPPDIPASTALPTGEQLVSDIRFAVEHRPEIRGLQAKRMSTDVSRRLAKNARLPVLDVSLSSSFDVGPEPKGSHYTDLLLGLTFKFPLLVRAARGKLRRANSDIRAIDAKTQFAADSILTQVRDAYSALKAAKAGLDIAKEEQVAAHRVEAAERQRFALGASTLFKVNLRELAAAEAEIRVIEAAAGYHQAHADYLAVSAHGLTRSDVQ